MALHKPLQRLHYRIVLVRGHLKMTLVLWMGYPVPDFCGMQELIPTFLVPWRQTRIRDSGAHVQRQESSIPQRSVPLFDLNLSLVIDPIGNVGQRA